jgi:outer membrane receptor protein involved in Fe transport
MNERFWKPSTAWTGSARRWLGVLVWGVFITAAVRADERPPQHRPPRNPWVSASGGSPRSVLVAQEAESPQPDTSQPDSPQPDAGQPETEEPEAAEPETTEPEPSSPEAEPSDQAQQPAVPDDVLELDIGELGGVEVEGSPFAPRMDSESVSGAERQLTAESAAANIIGGEEAITRATTDAGTLLGQSISNPGVYVQRRSPIIGDPRIRGYHFGQYLARADGAFWYPARIDVDSILSKIDSKIIDDVLIINGPYSARYGPGFSFIDLVTRSTPRADCGTSWDGASGLTYNANGEQWNANQFVQYAGEDYGALVFYSHLAGSDYEDGAGRLVPSSYKSRNLNVGIGADLTADTSIEFRYLRQDQTDVELAGQFTDIDFLVTDGFAVNLISEDQPFSDQLTLNTWYNRTRAEGSGGRSSKQALFNSVFNVPAPLPPPMGTPTLPRDSESAFDVAAAGYTLALTWGEPEDVQATLGSDLRYVRRSLTETLFRPDGSGGFRTGTNNVVSIIPDAESVNPGLFAELVVPMTDRLTLRTGARADWVEVKAGPGAISRRGGMPIFDVLGPDRDASYDLWSAYVTGDYALTEVFTANAGFGLAQRPPTLTELYAMRPFESVLQQGLNRIQGYPLLDPERLKQMDVGLRAESDSLRGGIRGFYAWIDDYITSQGIAVDPTSSSARITSVFVNTPEATLAGGEAFSEMDVHQNVTLFGSIMYVEGRNHSLNEFLFTATGPGGTPLPGDTAPPGSNQGAFFGRNAFDQAVGEEPLPQIPPLESRLGFRIHQSGPDPRWALEFAARIVDNQDRIASASLLEQPTPGFTTYDLRGYVRPYDDLSFIFGVLNLTDKLYREHLDTRAGDQLFQPGITAYLGTELTY